MTGAKSRLTMKEERFARLVAAEGHSLVAAYRLVYPPRNGERTVAGEYVAARRVAHRPRVELRIGELREEIVASDPAELRRRALGVLSRILAKQLDPRYRRTALDVLRYLDEHKTAGDIAGWEQYGVAVPQIAALNDIATCRQKHANTVSDSPRTEPTFPEMDVPEEPEIEQKDPLVVESPEDAERKLAEILQVVKDRQRMRFGQEPETPATQETEGPLNSPPQPSERDASEDNGFEYTGRPGFFGKGGWKRQRKSR